MKGFGTFASTPPTPQCGDFSDFVGLLAPAESRQARLKEVVGAVFSLNRDLRSLNDMVARASQELMAGDAAALKLAVASPDGCELTRLKDLSDIMRRSLRAQRADLLKDPAVKALYENELILKRLRQNLDGFAAGTARDLADILCRRETGEDSYAAESKSQDRIETQVCVTLWSECAKGGAVSGIIEPTKSVIGSLVREEISRLKQLRVRMADSAPEESRLLGFESAIGSKAELTERITERFCRQMYERLWENSPAAKEAMARGKSFAEFKKAVVAGALEESDLCENLRRFGIAFLERRFWEGRQTGLQERVVLFVNNVSKANEEHRRILGEDCDLPKKLWECFCASLTVELKTRGVDSRLSEETSEQSGSQILSSFSALFNPRKLQKTRTAVLGDPPHFSQ